MRWSADVVLPDDELRRIAALCAAFDVDGMRADLVVARTAVAHAAWRGATRARRRRSRTFASRPNWRCRTGVVATRSTIPGSTPTSWTRRWPRPATRTRPSPSATPTRIRPAAGESAGESPEQARPANGNPSLGAGARPNAPPAATFRTKALVVPGVGEGAPGRRSRARNRTGTTVSATDDPDVGHGVHLFGTLLAAAGRQQRRGRVSVAAADVRRAIREGREGNLVIFVVDASGSMAARDRMAAVGGATLSLLRDAYQRRDKVAVITFRGQRADLVLPPTSSVHIASRRLARFDTGGKTPLAEGLLAARDVVVREKVRDRARRSLVVVLTDGRATGGPDPLGRTRRAAGLLVAEGAAAVVVDCETSYVRLGLAEDLAKQLGAPVGTAGAASGGHPDPSGQVRGGARRRLIYWQGRHSMPQGQPLTVPDDGLTTRARRNAPLLAVHTGPGKGKSTAAFGMALRAWNQGFDVAVFQFVKSAKWKVGEEAAFRELGRLHDEHGIGGPVQWHKMGSGWSWSRKPGTDVDHAAAAADGWAEIARRLAAERHDFYVLDEFTYPLKWGWVDADEVVEIAGVPAGQPARGDHRPGRAAASGRRRRPGDRDDQGQAPDGRRAQGPARHRMVTLTRSREK